jgi:hypothetical protein
MSIKKEYDVSIFHADSVASYALELSAALRNAGVRAWMEAEIAPGIPHTQERWIPEVKRALEGTQVHVALLTPTMWKSPTACFATGGASSHVLRVPGAKLILVLKEGYTRADIPPVLRAAAPIVVDANKLSAKQLAAQLLPLLPNSVGPAVENAQSGRTKASRLRANRKSGPTPKRHAPPKKTAQSA